MQYDARRCRMRPNRAISNIAPISTDSAHCQNNDVSKTYYIHLEIFKFAVILEF